MPFIENTIAIKTSDSKMAQKLLDLTTQSIVLRLFEEFKIAKMEINQGKMRINISDPEIASEKYFSELLNIAIDLAEQVETRA